MAGVKGRSGTNKGKDKPWAEALRLVVFRDDLEGKRRLERIAERCAAAAEGGDMQAIKEIGDRLDGKPAQIIAGDDERDPISIATITRRIIKSGNQDSGGVPPTTPASSV